jgi:hypothetical protein
MGFVVRSEGRSGGGPIHVRRIPVVLFEELASMPSLIALPR